MDNKKKYTAPMLVKRGTIQDLTQGIKDTISPSDGWYLKDGSPLSTVS